MTGDVRWKGWALFEQRERGLAESFLAHVYIRFHEAERGGDAGRCQIHQRVPSISESPILCCVLETLVWCWPTQTSFASLCQKVWGILAHATPLLELYFEKRFPSWNQTNESLVFHAMANHKTQARTFTSPGFHLFASQGTENSLDSKTSTALSPAKKSLQVARTHAMENMRIGAPQGRASATKRNGARRTPLGGFQILLSGCSKNFETRHFRFACRLILSSFQLVPFQQAKRTKLDAKRRPSGSQGDRLFEMDSTWRAARWLTSSASRTERLMAKADFEGCVSMTLRSDIFT